MSGAAAALVALCALCLSGLGVYAWRRRRVRGAWPLALLAFSLAAFLVCTLARALLPAEQAPVWSALRATIGSAAPVYTLLFVLEACRREGLSRRLRRIVHVWPAFNGLLAVRAVAAGSLGVPPAGGAGTGDRLLDLGSGVGGLVMSGAALLMLLVYVARSGGRERSQAGWYLAAMAVGGVGPVIDGYVWHTGLGVLTAVTWLLECGLFGLTIHRFGVLGALPVAHERVLREIDLGIVVVDSAGRVIAANRFALHALGLARGTVRGRVLSSLGDPAAGLAGLAEAAPAVRRAWLVEGRQTVFECSCARMSDTRAPAGARAYLLADVSERVRAEQTLQQSTVDLDRLVGEQTGSLARLAADLAGENRRIERINALLAEAQRIARLGSWTWARDGNRFSISGEMQRLLGVDAVHGAFGLEDVLARLHPEDRDGVHTAALALAHGEPGPPLRARAVLPDGRERWILLHATRVLERDAAGVVSRVIGTAQDITDVHEAEQRLTRDAEELESRVAARSRELLVLSRELDEVTRLAVVALAPSLDRIEALVDAVARREHAAPQGLHDELGRIRAAAGQLRTVAREARARADAAVLPLRDR